MELTKDKWYRFSPYTDKTLVWYQKAKGNGWDAKLYISQNDPKSPIKFTNGTGSFLEKYCEQDPTYFEVSAREHLWLEEIVNRGEYFPIEEFKTDEVINNYNIY